jgi:hypothetical protein
VLRAADAVEVPGHELLGWRPNVFRECTVKTILGSALFAVVTLAPHMATAGPAELEEIRRGCATSLGARCECFVQAATGLSDREQAYIAALFAQDAARTQVAVMAMSQAEITNSMSFFQTTSVACSRAPGAP